MQNVYALESGDDLERQVIAAYIYKFGDYISWPENTFRDTTSPIIIGVVDDEIVANELNKISQSHLLGNHPVVIKKLSSKNLVEDVHILYIANETTKSMTEYRTLHPQLPVLYISNTLDGLQSGSVINFVHDNNRLRFDISLATADINKIKISAPLLMVARKIQSK